MTEVNTSIDANGKEMRFLGVGDHGMSDNLITRQPGRPCAFFPKGEYAGQLKREKGK
jgi:hypothetical protein